MVRAKRRTNSPHSAELQLQIAAPVTQPQQHTREGARRLVALVTAQRRRRTLISAGVDNLIIHNGRRKSNHMPGSAAPGSLVHKLSAILERVA